MEQNCSLSLGLLADKMPAKTPAIEKCMADERKKTKSKRRKRVTDKGDVDTSNGLKKWQSDYNNSILNLESVKKEIAKYLVEYEKRESEEAERRKQMEGNADDEGWITVVNPKKRRLIPANSSNKVSSRKRSRSQK